MTRIFSEGVVLPHFLNVFQHDRSTEFSYILEAMQFLNKLVKGTHDLTEPTQFEYISQTIGHHLENYLRYNRRDPTELDMILGLKKAGGAQKHMEVISLAVLRTLYEKDQELAMQALATLPLSQVDYINQMSQEYDPGYHALIQGVVESVTELKAAAVPVKS